ncbi:MAG TPA: addiction module protein [Thermodesulfovibrionia bacterium]|jgi:putative addiction module component (TIGR02574 family)|nr:addiction module protein [Thermodesulfovibrionia bacterium]
MENANKLIDEAESLPLDLKTLLIDRLLNSLNPSSKEIDELWAKEAERRVEEIKNGLVEPIAGEKVFKEIQERLSK